MQFCNIISGYKKGKLTLTNPPKDGLDLYLLLAEYFGYYNNQWRHQSLDDEIPNEVYQKSVELLLLLTYDIIINKTVSRFTDTVQCRFFVF